MGYRVITTQAGQTVADLTLQAYGSIAAKAMNALVGDNPAVFPDGITTLVPAGVPVKVRTEAPFANSQVQGFFYGKELNSTYKEGSSGFSLPDEGEIENPTGLTEIIVGKRGQWRIGLHLAWKEQGEIFGGSAVILAYGSNAEAAIRVDIPDHVSYDPELASQIMARYDGDNIILMLNTAGVSVLKYKIISSI